jgi:hypothetical protein
MSEEQLELWEETTKKEEISVFEIDQALSEYAAAREDYETKKQISNEADRVAKEKKAKLITILESSGKKRWAGHEGNVTITEKMSVKVPKDLENKAKMLKFFKEYGPDQYLSMVTVNFQTLNAFFNQQNEENPEFKIPGVDDPVVEKNIQFRRKSK